MEQFWRALSAVASDHDFFDEIAKIAKCVVKEELAVPPAIRDTLPPAVKQQFPDLSIQPDFVAIRKMKQTFKLGKDINLSIYETCEINRLFYTNPTRKNMDALVEYWNALGTFTHGKTTDPNFMAIIGAMAIDSAARFDFAEGVAPLAKFGMALSANDEVALRQFLATNGAADVRARRFRDESWSGSCGEIADPYDGWIHFNV